MTKKRPPPGSGPDEQVTPLWGKEPMFYLVVALPFMICVVASLAISSLKCLQLTRPERLTIIVEVSYQNIGIASAVAIAAFCDNPRQRADSAAVPIIYGLIQATALAGICLCAWRLGWTYAPVDAGLCKIVKGDYQ